MFELTAEQEREGRKVLEAGREACLVGPAGTGKTTLLRWLAASFLQSGWPVVLGTPAGKAAVVLARKAGLPASTVHGLIYGPPEDSTGTSGEDGDRLVFGDPHPPCGPGEAVIIDEAGMLGSEVYRDFMRELPQGARVVWVGDREQVLPVKDTWGPPLDRPTAVLTQIHRQAAGNPIIQYGVACREGRASRWRRAYDGGDPRLQFRSEPVTAAVRWAVEAYQAGRDATVLTFTHRVRERINQEVRRAMGFTATIQAGDRLVIRMNSRSLGLMNGEVVTVTGAREIDLLGVPAWEVEIAERPWPIRIFSHLLNDRSRQVWDARRQIGLRRWDDERVAHAWHGQCLTVHSSQGSEWADVAFVTSSAMVYLGREDPEAARRLVYTAVTRAAERLVVFDTRGRR